MTRIPAALAGTLLATACGLAAAQTIKPGLWEVNTRMGGNPEMDKAMAQMQQQMAAMPPEQRKMMQDMMAKQGVSIGAGGTANGIRYCLGKEQAERGEPPQDKDGRCKRDSLERSGATTRFKFSCSNPPSSGSGEFTLVSDKAYTMKMVVEQSGQGRPQRMEMQQQGKWLGADCGNLKPRN